MADNIRKGVPGKNGKIRPSTPIPKLIVPTVSSAALRNALSTQSMVISPIEKV
jgi:hypothetical protein